MQDLDEISITAAVLERVGQAGSPRTRHISEALVRHLHAFVREIEPTQKEWAEAIAFLTCRGIPAGRGHGVPGRRHAGRRCGREHLAYGR